MIYLKKIFKILNTKQKLYLFLLLFFILFSVLIEMLSIGLLIPFIYFITDPEAINKYYITKNIYLYLGQPEGSRFIIIGLIFIISVFLFKAIISSVVRFVNLKIMMHISLELTDRFFMSYLYQPYLFHLKTNTSKLLRNVLSEAHHFSSFIHLSINIMSEFLLIGGIFLLLLYFEPFGILSLMLLSLLVAGIYYLLFSNKSKTWGTRRQEYDYQRIDSIQQGFNAIKELKLYALEDYFASKQHVSNKNSLSMHVQKDFINFLSTPIFEFTAVCGLSIFLIIMIFQLNPDQTIESLLPILVLIGAATFRLMPALSSISTKLQTLRFLLPAVDIIYNELANILEEFFSKKEIDSFKFKKRIELKNLSFQFPDTKSYALDNLNFSIEKNEIVGIIGKSGAGKSTLIDILLGLLEPNKGIIYSDSIDIYKQIRSWQKLIGYVPQNVYLLDDTIKNNILFGIQYKKDDDEYFQSILTKSQLTEFVNQLPDGVETKVGERGIRISGGQRQRVAIARALYRNPEILLFDEATSALDTETEKNLINSVDKLKREKTIIMVAHRLSTVSICDKIIELKEGKIINQGTYSEVLLKS